MNVAFCTAVMPAPHISHPDAPPLAVAARLLSLGYVLEEVRFKGTAYGGGCGYNGSGRTWTFHSYRDPWINRTLDVYTAALQHVKNADWSQADVIARLSEPPKKANAPSAPRRPPAPPSGDTSSVTPPPAATPAIPPCSASPYPTSAAS